MNSIAKSLVYTLAGLWLSQTASQGQISVNYNAGFGLPDVVDSAGVPLALGNEVRIGFFPTDFDFASLAGSLAALDAAWTQFDSTTIRDIAPIPGGELQLGRFAATAESSDATFNNQRITLWIFKTADNLPPTLGYGNVAEYGLFSSTLANWKFPVQGDVFNSTIVGSSEVNQFYHSGLVAGSPGSLQLAPVPEPIGYAVGTGLALIAFAAARWRRTPNR